MTAPTHDTPHPLETEIARQLTEREGVDKEALDRAQRLALSEGKRFWNILPRLGLVPEAQLTELIAEITGIPLVTGKDFPEGPLFADKISPRFLREYQVLPLAEEEDHLVVAVADPANDYAVKAISKAVGRPVKVVIAQPGDIDANIERFFGDGRSAMARLTGDTDKAGAQDTDLEIALEDLEILKDSASEAPVVQLVNLIIERAVEAGASDIHIEPFERRLIVRYRIDGVLKPVESPSGQLAGAIISRIKLMASLDIAERRLPQDGRVKFPVRGTPVDMRVSTMPSLYGESVVLRILDRSHVELDLEKLGFANEAAAAIRNLIRRPNGIVLIVGPTGSGKTTTLYAALDDVNDPTKKMLTVEDPIEYQLAGIVQTQIKPAIGLGFAEVLRSALRQDPDIMMVGEIRDLETAEIAVQAALTGHSVFSTVHTNGATATVTRLVDMGIEPYLLAATLGGVVAQRLVRRLCPDCKAKTKVDAAVLGRSKANGGSGKNVTVWKPVGCPACSGTGYRGRTVIYEILEITEAMQHALSRFTGQEELASLAAKAGVRTLRASGMDKVIAGETSLEEVIRVTIET